jgi:hypothetical protein
MVGIDQPAMRARRTRVTMLPRRVAASRKTKSSSGRQSKWWPSAKTSCVGGGIFPCGMCNHLFETTSRYDHERRVLTFLLFCPACETETVVETLRYEPAFRRLGVLTDGGSRR